MTVWFAQWTLDVQDVSRMAEFWSAALGYEVEYGDNGTATLFPPNGSPRVWLQNTGQPKQEKNRFHPDLRPDDGDVDKAVARLLELGARHADVGQTGDEAFVVLADPEDNEFCVLKRDPAIR